MSRQTLTLFIIALLVTVVGIYFFSSNNMNMERDNQPTLTLPDRVVTLEIADTLFKRQRGLSGRESLSENAGMLFVFDESDLHGFWMKDMNFAIDIIWLDEQFRVVGIEENAHPDSYPQIFYPDSPALYVVEVVTGFVASEGVEKGAILEVST